MDLFTTLIGVLLGGGVLAFIQFLITQNLILKIVNKILPNNTPILKKIWMNTYIRFIPHGAIPEKQFMKY